MNLTLSVKRDVAERARKTARGMGKSLNQLIREYLDELAGVDRADDDIEELRRLSRESGGRLRGWAFDRDELHERS